MPGIPCVYYGSEWGAQGKKQDGDPALRPCFEKPEENDLTQWIAACAKAFSNSKALQYGSYKTVMQQNHQLIFERKYEGQRVLVAINASAEPYHAHFDAQAGRARDLITGGSPRLLAAAASCPPSSPPSGRSFDPWKRDSSGGCMPLPLRFPGEK